MSEFQEDTTNMDDALASFVSVERVRHGIDEEPASVDAEPAPDEDPADESAAAADDEQPGDGQAVDDSASGDDTPPEDPDDSPDTTDGDGPQADAGEDTRTQEELLEALKKSEERVVALEHTNDSNKGRVKALQRKGQSLRNQLSALGTSRVGPSQETAQRELTEAESELAQLKEEMGEDYPATIKLVNAALRVNSLRTAGAVDEKLDPLRTAAETLITEEVHSDSVEVAELLSAKYDVPGLVNSEGFAKWLEVLPPTYRELFDNSEDPADQLMILDTYAEGRDVSEFLVNPPAQTEPVETTDSDKDLPPSNDGVRSQQEKDAADIDGKANALPDPAGPAGGAADNSAEASFAIVEKEKQRAREGRTRRVEIP